MTDNDRRAWDRRFAGSEWDDVQGDALTLRFAECILEHLPVGVKALMGDPSTKVLDWGCARGQLVALWRQRFPCEVTGLDFSGQAVVQAKERWGERQGYFIFHPDGSILNDWDVIVTSNVMEHLVDPVAILKEHLPRCRRFYVILTPYREPLGGEDREAMTPEQRDAAGHVHVQQFDDESFPDAVDGFRKQFQTHDVVPGPLWPGQQLLAVYERL